MVTNSGALALRRFLSQLPVRIDKDVYQRLSRIAQTHLKTEFMVEKAVDVMIAVDMVELAMRNKYDAAYLLSADGDFTPAVEAVRRIGKKVYVASPARGQRLAAVATCFIPLQPAWFDDCFEEE